MTENENDYNDFTKEELINRSHELEEHIRSITEENGSSSLSLMDDISTDNNDVDEECVWCAMRAKNYRRDIIAGWYHQISNSG